MRTWSLQWNAELDRQLHKHDLVVELWFWHFGMAGILPEDEDARCENCADHSIGCPDIPGDPLECMKRGGKKKMRPFELDDSLEELHELL
jgi:hypothetical protein